MLRNWDTTVNKTLPPSPRALRQRKKLSHLSSGHTESRAQQTLAWPDGESKKDRSSRGLSSGVPLLPQQPSGSCSLLLQGCWALPPKQPEVLSCPLPVNKNPSSGAYSLL